MTRVLIADADSVARSALILLLKHKFGIQEIGEIDDAWGLVECVQQFKPDCILLDWELPNLEVARILPAFQRSESRPPVIVMSSRAENEPWALACGAAAFLPKLASAEEVLGVLKHFLNG